jgi:hypothetical protein
MPQRISEQIRVFPAVEPEAHFFAIGLEMFRADTMPRSYDAALQERERGFNGVRMDVTVNVNLKTMPNCFVLMGDSHAPGNALVDAKVISHQDLNIFANVFANVFFKRAPLNILSVKEAEIAAALADANNRFLVTSASSLIKSASASADIRFVNLDLTVQHGFVALRHCCPDAMAQIPRRLIGDSKCTFNLIRTHSFAGFHQQHHGEKPRLKRKMRIVKNRLGHYTKLVAALAALKLALSSKLTDLLALAADAFHAVGPAQLFEQFAAAVVSRIQFINFGECHG